MEKELRIDGSVEAKDGREFTRLIGGFGEDKPIFAIWQASELLGLEVREISQNYRRNVNNFETGLDVVDIKSAITQNDGDRKQAITTLSEGLGIHRNRLNATKEWLAFSYSGMLKLIKIATTKESWSMYENFIEDYFKTKAENVVMENTIQEQIQNTKEQRAYFMGMAMMESSESKRMELMGKAEKLNRQMAKMEKSITEEEVKKQVVEGLKPQLHIADIISSAKGCYDIGVFAKVLNIEGVGRNNMFKWLREQKILMDTNVPYQRYAKYFKVIPDVNRNGYKNDKSLIRPIGVEYLVKRLIDDGRVITSSVGEILNQLEGAE